MSRKETAAQQPVGPRRSKRSRRPAPRDAEASDGSWSGVPGEVRAGTHLVEPAPSGRPPLGAPATRGGEAGEGRDPWLLRAGRGGLRADPLASLRIPSLRSSGRKTPVESAAGNFSVPDPPAITEFGFRVCTIVLALESRETGAWPGWVRGSLRAETESPGLGPHV